MANYRGKKKKNENEKPTRVFNLLIYKSQLPANEVERERERAYSRNLFLVFIT